jgi:hypothetical protein
MELSGRFPSDQKAIIDGLRGSRCRDLRRPGARRRAPRHHEADLHAHRPPDSRQAERARNHKQSLAGRSSKAFPRRPDNLAHCRSLPSNQNRRSGRTGQTVALQCGCAMTFTDDDLKRVEKSRRKFRLRWTHEDYEFFHRPPGSGGGLSSPVWRPSVNRAYADLLTTPGARRRVNDNRRLS